MTRNGSYAPLIEYDVLELRDGGAWRVYRKTSSGYRYLGMRFTLAGVDRLIERDRKQLRCKQPRRVRLGWLA